MEHSVRCKYPCIYLSPKASMPYQLQSRDLQLTSTQIFHSKRKPKSRNPDS